MTLQSTNQVVHSSKTGAIIKTFAVGSAPAGVVFDGANIWVANSNAATVTKIGPALNVAAAVIGTFPVGQTPFGLAFDGAFVWVSNSLSSTLSKK